MPSHTSNADGSYRIKSDGRSITTAEWRANQLADSLAKKGALVSPLRDEADKMVKAAGEAILQSASKLGVVTLAANAHLVEGVREDGTKFSVTKRDSTPMPQALVKARDETRIHAVTAIAGKQLAPPAAPRVVAPLVPLTLVQTRGLKRRAEVATRKQVEDEHLRQVVAETAARGTTQPESATDRLAALRLRVLAKNTRVSP
jgi:hypothetical protein